MNSIDVTFIDNTNFTVSDRCSSGETEDKSGQLLRSLVSKHLSPVFIKSALVPDELAEIKVRKFNDLRNHSKY